MGNDELLDSGISADANLSLNAAAKDFLKQTATWAKLLAIASIIFSVVILVFGTCYVYMNNFAKAAEGAEAYQDAAGAAGYKIGYYFGSGLGLVLMVLLLLYPAIRMLQFSKSARTALQKNDTAAIEMSIKRLRSIFRFYGILTIITVVFYLLAIVIVLIQSRAVANQ